MNAWPRAKCWRKFEKQQASGCRRASMIFALGRIKWMNGTNSQLFGSLSMKKGCPVRRCTPARLRYSSPEHRATRPSSTSCRWGKRRASRDQRRNVGQLGRPLDQAVRGEDLFDQRGAGSWHADDEDRVGRLAARPPFSESLSGERVDAAVHDPS